MKNIKYIGFVLAFVALSANVSFAQKNVSWLHGLGENGSTWNSMESIFESERTSILPSSTFSPGYPSMSGINNASNFVTTRIPNDPSSIVIGHSMGGVVARDIDISNPGQIGGIITVGAPNDGAAIANSLADGDVDRATTNACSALSAGPLSEIPGISIIISGIIPDIICNVVSDLIVEDLLEDQNNQSAQDLAVGGAIPGSTSGIPQVSIWGNENSPVHWRLMSSLESGNSNDTRWVNIAEDFRETYQDFFLVHTGLAVTTGILGFLFPPLWGATAKESFSAIQWKRGVRWFDNSEALWNQLIDCGGDDLFETTVTVQVPSDDFYCAEQLSQGGQWCLEYESCLDYWALWCELDPSDCWVEIEETVYMSTNGRSDGFICENSQVGSIASDEYEARGANHSDEVVHNNVKLQIDKVFNTPGVFFTP